MLSTMPYVIVEGFLGGGKNSKYTRSSAQNAAVTTNTPSSSRNSVAKHTSLQVNPTFYTAVSGLKGNIR